MKKVSVLISAAVVALTMGIAACGSSGKGGSSSLAPSSETSTSTSSEDSSEEESSEDSSEDLSSEDLSSEELSSEESSEELSSEELSSEEESSEELSSEEESSEESSEITPYDYDDSHLQQVNPYDFTTTYRGMRINGTGYAAEQYTEYKQDGKKKYVISDVKALVVPVDFTDYPAEDLPLGAEGTKDVIENMIFGDSEQMEWYSLAGYYESSSYGQCKITGDILDWWHVDSTVAAYAREYGTSGASKVAIAIQDYYHTQYSNAKALEDQEMMDKYDLRKYDANKDGYVDSIIMIYSAPITTTGELQWAFCSSVPGAWGKYNPILEGANRFFWASYWFFYDAYLNNYQPTQELIDGIKAGTIGMDAHTMTHEYGHVLGLPDYYITDYDTSDFDGMGYLDMMDYNIGDHNSVSKSWYGWVDPKYVTGSVKTTLRSATTTGDCLIIPIQGEYKNTLMDQYIMVEFITPEGVAQLDGVKPLTPNYPLYYNQAGIRVLHVDARLGVFNYNTTTKDWSFGGFTSSTNRPSDNSYVSTACSNTGNDSCFKNYKLLEILPSNGKSIKYAGQATNEALFHEGDVFGENGIYENYMMHDISGGKTVPLGFKFSVDKMNGNDSVELTITRI